jgi:hypothetical protein
MKLEKIEKCKLKILLTYKLCKNSIKKESILKSQKINIQNITDEITGIEFFKMMKTLFQKIIYIVKKQEDYVK